MTNATKNGGAVVGPDRPREFVNSQRRRRQGEAVGLDQRTGGFQYLQTARRIATQMSPHPSGADIPVFDS